MRNFYVGEPASRIGLMLLAVVLATIFIVDAAKRIPLIREKAIGIVLWRVAVLAYELVWLVPNALREKGGMDASGYHERGLRIAEAIWHGTWSGAAGRFGTQTMDAVTGLMYVPFGGDFYGFFALSAAFSLIGMLFQFEAFYLWYPGQHAKRYLALLTFFPSYAIWSSLAGKDSLIALGLGMASLGYSRMLRKRSVAALILGLAGVCLVTIIRPHVALMLALAIASTSLLKGAAPSGPNKRQLLASSLTRTAILLIVLGPMILLLHRITSSFVKHDITNTNSLLQVESRVAQNNSYGGSAVQARTVSSPAEFFLYLPEGLTRIYLRPFLGEGHNLNMILAGVENAFLALLLLRVAFALRITSHPITTPLALFALIMTIELSLLFCMLTNFGLISRQRAQLLPFFFAIAVIVIRQRTQTGSISEHVSFTDRIRSANAAFGEQASPNVW